MKNLSKVIFLSILISCGKGGDSAPASTFPTDGVYAYSDGKNLAITLEIHADSVYEITWFDMINDRYYSEHGAYGVAGNAVSFQPTYYYPTGCDSLEASNWTYTTTPSFLTLNNTADDFVITGEKIDINPDQLKDGYDPECF